MIPQHSVDGVGLQRSQPGCIADALPIARERFARPFATVDRKPIGKGRPTQRSGAGRAEPLEGQVFFVQEPVEHTPGEGTMRSASLEGQVDGSDLVGEFRFVTDSPRRLRPFRRVPLRSNFHSNPIRLHAQSIQWQQLDYSEVQKRTSITWTCIAQMDGSRRKPRPYFSRSEGDRLPRLGRSDPHL